MKKYTIKRSFSISFCLDYLHEMRYGQTANYSGEFLSEYFLSAMCKWLTTLFVAFSLWINSQMFLSHSHVLVLVTVSWFYLLIADEAFKSKYKNSFYFVNNPIPADIEQLKHQQMIVLILMIISLALFISVHGFHLLRWLRKKDYLTFGSMKHMGASKKKQIHPTEITVANPHTQSPKLNLRKVNGTGVPTNSAFSVSGKGKNHYITVACQREKQTNKL